MSLALLQGYSAAEDDESVAAAASLSDSGDSSAEEAGSNGDEASAHPKPAAKPRGRSNPSRGDAGGGGGDPSLPSALDVFAEVSGPPDFLGHRVAELEEARGVLDRRSEDGSKQPPPVGAVAGESIECVYTVYIRTGSIWKAGTDPNITLQLAGADGNGKEETM